MTLEQLRIFVAVATREHVTQGARDLNLTQSATSAAIAALEARYATKLFDRVGRRVVLTEAGRVFLEEARAVLARASAAETVLADLAGLKRGSLRVAASQTVANYWLPHHLARFHEAYPGIAVQVTIGNTGTTAALVHEGSADLGIIEGAIDDPHLAISTVAQDELVLVVSPHHPWAGIERLEPAALETSRWVLREPGSGTRQAFEEALGCAGLALADIEVALEIPSNEAVRAAVEAGSGAAIMSRLVVEQSVRLGTLALVPFALPPRRFLALRHKQRHVTRAAEELSRLIADGLQPAR